MQSLPDACGTCAERPRRREGGRDAGPSGGRRGVLRAGSRPRGVAEGRYGAGRGVYPAGAVTADAPAQAGRFFRAAPHLSGECPAENAF